MLSLLSRTHGPEYLGQQFPLPVHLHEAEVILVAHGRHVHPEMHARDLVARHVDRQDLVGRLAGKGRTTAHALQIGRLVPEGRAASLPIRVIWKRSWHISSKTSARA
jgi:hypothetical protein